MQGIPGSVLFCSLQWISLTGKLKLEDPVSSAVHLKPCTHLDTLWFPRTYVKIKLCLLIHGMYPFRSFVSDSVWFPPPHSVSCEGFSCFQQPRLKYMKTAHLLSTLPPSCLHLKATQRQETVRVFSLRAECILQPPGRTFFLLKQTPCFLTD